MAFRFVVVLGLVLGVSAPLFVCGCGRDGRGGGGGGVDVDAGPAVRRDAGPGMDSGLPARDAGPARIDSGPVRRDAGPSRDAGRLRDAGRTGFDSGFPSGDAGGFPGGDAGFGTPCTSDADCTGGRCCPIMPGFPFGLCMAVCTM